MIVNVRGTNTRNKGAELMLRAVVAALGERHEVAVDPATGSFPERREIGVWSRLGNGRTDLPLAVGARVLPHQFRRRLRDGYGVVTDAAVEAELDASGFAYSDQFDLHRARVAADRAQALHGRGVPFVLLPQAFGPFTSPALRSTAARLVDRATLVHAREPASLEHVLGLGARTDHVRLAPDFTCLLPGELPAGFEPVERLALVVPSAKLLTETAPEVRAAYLPFLARAVERLRAEGHDVRLLLHERGDVATIEALQELLAAPAPVVAHSSPVHLKGVIGTARVVVGSRFHALVSALSQGVPALGIGWSHKYRMLFDDYGVGERVVAPTIDDDELADHLAALTAEPAHGPLVASLRAAADVERVRAQQMWTEVEAAIAPRGEAVGRSA
jgi:colanic acid/amylovoran biosynthesis protein